MKCSYCGGNTRYTEKFCGGESAFNNCECGAPMIDMIYNIFFPIAFLIGIMVSQISLKVEQ